MSTPHRQKIESAFLPYLVDLGLTDAETDGLLDRLADDLEMRVGCALREGMTDAQLNEFGVLLDGDATTAAAWAHRQQIDPLGCTVFQFLLGDDGTAEGFEAALREWAPTRWLEVNRPDYREVVASCLAQLQLEVLGALGLGGSPA